MRCFYRSCGVALFCLFACTGSDDWSNYRFTNQIETELNQISPKGDRVAWADCMVDYAFIPDADRMQKVFEFEKGRVKPILPNWKEYKQCVAADLVLKEAEKYRVMALNETHWLPTHRAFAHNLLAGLYQRGYRYLGIEALHHLPAGFPGRRDGYYLAEPTFGHLVREALALGFTVFGYEAQNGVTGKERELQQAQHITRFMRSHPDGKYLLYCGFDHIKEGPVAGWDRAMVGWLKLLLDCEVFTVNQTEYNQMDQVTGNEPVVLVNANGKLFRPSQQCDWSVFHPAYTPNKDNLLAWKRNVNNRWLSIPLLKKDKRFPVLVMAFINSENPEHAVPFDCIELKDTAEVEKLLVPVNDSFSIYYKEKGGGLQYWPHTNGKPALRYPPFTNATKP